MIAFLSPGFTAQQKVAALVYRPTEKIVARTPVTFKQADVVRAVKAARAAGLPVMATQITPDGTIRLIHAEAHLPPSSDYDRFEAEL